MVESSKFTLSHVEEGMNKLWLKIPLVFLGVVLIMALAGIGIALGYQKVYEQKTYPGVYIGVYHLGGMSKAEIKKFIESFNNRVSKEGVSFYYTDKSGEVRNFKINTIASAENSIEMVKLDSEDLADKAIRQGRSGSFWPDMLQPFYYRFFVPAKIVVEVDIKEHFLNNLQEYLSNFGDKPRDANVKIKNVNPLSYQIEPEQKGVSFDLTKVKPVLIKHLSELSLTEVGIEKMDFSPAIVKEEAAKSAQRLPEILSYGSLNLNYVNPHTQEREDWQAASELYVDWIEIRKDKSNELFFALDETAVKNYLNGLKVSLEKEPIDAKFSIKDGRVAQFQASQPGVKVDVDKTYVDLDKMFQERNYRQGKITKTVSISTTIVEPKVNMANVNNLGITDVLGAGKSSFKYSHGNRIKNIANAVKRLNGLLIKPEEIFSTNYYAGPYATSSGYLPEEVIVGNKIQIEVGGGMCQIGTTLFRMAMNAAMPIVERQNHSLVVRYYADPVNGNPGTDATVYDPYVDFKFRNDTGNYLLLQTEIDYVKEELTFTLWGKSDGRKGWYDHPVVSEWFNPGKDIEAKVADLKPGEKKCQNAFVGAKSKFIYTRVTSSTQKIEQVFESYYRPLPKICMIGVELKEFCQQKENKGDKQCEGVDFSSTSSTLNVPATTTNTF